jgi:uncharacterized protein
MNAPRDRAWRFIHPDAPVPLEATGVRLSPRGGVDLVEGDDAVRQAILLLLSTVPGERVMRPEYGCAIHRLVFSPNDDTTAGLAIYYVQRALDRWEPRVEVVNLDAGRNEEAPERLNITLDYRVRATQRTAQLAVSVNLTRG